MAEPADWQQLDRLLARLVDETLTAQDAAELEARLRADPSARRHFVHYLDLHAELRDRAATAGGGFGPTIAASPTRRRLMLPVAASLAAGLLVVAGAWLGHEIFPAVVDGGDAPGPSIQRPPTKPPEPAADAERTDDGAAMLRRATDVIWEMDAPPLQGESLAPTRLRWAGGEITVEFFSGAVVTLEGPADFEVVSASRAICRRGRLRGEVPPQARGFAIATPSTELVDLGTEFGMNVFPGGPTDVHVFAGRVDLFPPAPRDPSASARAVVAGQTVRVEAGGEARPLTADPARFASPTPAGSTPDARARRVEAWRLAMTRIRSDPRLAVLYDFEPRGDDVRTLHDHQPARDATDGTIVGCGWTTGRWPGKSALELRRPCDRVRCDISGKFDEMTLTAWVRIDGLDNRLQGLLLTDGYQVGRPHWQITSDGEIRLGIRMPDVGGRLAAGGYGSPVVFDARRLGVWTFLATTYDRQARIVCHYVDGRRVSEGSLAFDQPLRIGLAEIGNWGAPLRPDRHPVRNLNGCIDELAIWKAALDGAEITRLYEAGRP